MSTARGLDNEFMQYWLKLSLGQKESLLNVAKNFVGIREEDNTVDLRKKLIQEEREKYLRVEDRSFSWEEVKVMASNKERRNAL